MALTLDPATEQRIQREIDLGHASDPAELLNRALDLLSAQESWSEEEKHELTQSLDRAMEQIKRGEGISAENIREHLAQRRAARVG